MQTEENKKEIEAEHYEVDLSNIPQMSAAGHQWEQRGPTLLCLSCPYEHSQFIPPNLEYKGLDDKGLPILKPFNR